MQYKIRLIETFLMGIMCISISEYQIFRPVLQIIISGLTEMGKRGKRLGREAKRDAQKRLSSRDIYGEGKE